MHIGVVGSMHPDSLSDNIVHTLKEMGHQVTELGSSRNAPRSWVLARGVDIAQQALPRLEARSHHRVAVLALESECELVINTEGTLAPEAVAHMRSNGIKVTLWFPDAVSNLGRQRMLTAPYTCMFFKDALLVDRLRATLSLPVWFLPEACNPTWHTPIGSPAKNRYVAVVGNTYLTRLLLLERLHHSGVPLKIFGSPFPRWAPKVLPPHLHMGRSVHREEKSRVFRESLAVLNNLHPAEMTSVNARLFEATGAGAAVLCENRPGLEDLFDVEREVLSFGGFDDLLQHIRRLMSEPDATREVGDAAAKRAHFEHTYDQRLSVMLEKLT